MFIIWLVLSLLSTWLVIVVLVNDFSLKTLNLKNLLGKKGFNSLIIYPHPDDETMASGGLIQILKKYGNVKVITVTKGQYGTELVKLPPNELAELRSNEFKGAMKALNINDYELWEFIDGTLIENTINLTKQIKDTINSYNPDLIVTYERSGVYGHPDHISLSKAVNESVENTNIKVLYSTLPKKILKKFKLPTTLNGIPIPEFQKQSEPEFKLFTLKYNLAKLRASKKYKSQNLSHGIPLEVMHSVNIFEYYTTKYKD